MLRSAKPLCISMAQRTASTTLRNSTRLPSPVRLKMAPIVHSDGRVDQIAAQRPEPCQREILIRAGKTAVSDNIRDQDRRDLPGSRHGDEYVRPYFKAQKNDDRDAEGIAEAATRPTMRFVELKS